MSISEIRINLRDYDSSFFLVKDTLQNQILHLFPSLKITESHETCSFRQGLSPCSASHPKGLPLLQRSRTCGRTRC